MKFKDKCYEVLSSCIFSERNSGSLICAQNYATYKYFTVEMQIVDGSEVKP
jgi:hypothetical protein